VGQSGRNGSQNRISPGSFGVRCALAAARPSRTIEMRARECSHRELGRGQCAANGLMTPFRWTATPFFHKRERDESNTTGGLKISPTFPPHELLGAVGLGVESCKEALEKSGVTRFSQERKHRTRFRKESSSTRRKGTE